MTAIEIIAARWEKANTNHPWEAYDATDNVVSPSEITDYTADGHAFHPMWWVRGLEWNDQDLLCEGLFLHRPDAEVVVHAPTDVALLLAVARAAQRAAEMAGECTVACEVGAPWNELMDALEQLEEEA